MLSFFIGLLTLLLLLSCGLLILLVLVQLPKKDAGAGMAFGAGTADALLGAGSGNALTKITKYVAASFFILSVALWLTYNQKTSRRVGDTQRALQQLATQPGATPPPAQVAPAVPTQPSGSLFQSNTTATPLLPVPAPATNQP